MRPSQTSQHRNTSGVAQRNLTDMRIPQEPDKHTHQPRIYPVKVYESTHSPEVDDHRSVARTADVHEWRWSIGGAARVAAILGSLYKCSPTLRLDDCQAFRISSCTPVGMELYMRFK